MRICRSASCARRCVASARRTPSCTSTSSQRASIAADRSPMREATMPAADARISKQKRNSASAIASGGRRPRPSDSTCAQRMAGRHGHPDALNGSQIGSPISTPAQWQSDWATHPYPRAVMEHRLAVEFKQDGPPRFGWKSKRE
eukprot:359768-Chlamydomonas_euryale.AAC.8